MCNGITNHCKTLNHKMFLYFLAFIGCFIIQSSLATTVSINVYLKLKPNNPVTSLITDFNQMLQEKKIFRDYHIKPFLKTHPLHLTLYLASYDKKKINAIIKQTQALAQQQHKIRLAPDRFIVSDSGYVMLSVKNSIELQELSNKVLMALNKARDKSAPIPAWAGQDPQRRRLFNRYGSPNVLNYFNPHFSIFDPEDLSHEESLLLHAKLQKLVIQFSHDYLVERNTQAYAIGVGLANRQGQIIKELSVLELR